jgi:hypothetical protein
MRKRLSFGIFIGLLVLTHTVYGQVNQAPQDQSTEKLMEMLRQEALLVEINAVIRNKDNQALWTTEIREITVFGKQVQVRISGHNITVAADFTPYTQDRQQVMLLAQGQTWVRVQNSDQIRYQSALRTMPITLGEPILFFPLGIDSNDSSETGFGSAILELEVTVHSLADVLGASDNSSIDPAQSSPSPPVNQRQPSRPGSTTRQQ